VEHVTVAKQIGHPGISGASPWARTRFQVLRGPEEVWRLREVPGTPMTTGGGFPIAKVVLGFSNAGESKAYLQVSPYEFKSNSLDVVS
jgi:hypothetical protein